MLSNNGNNRTSLASTSVHFSKIEYSLQKALKASTAKVTSALVVSNPHQLLEFEKQSSDKLTLESWVDAATLSGAHSDEELLKRMSTFSMPSGGMKFSVGNLKLDATKQGSTKIVKRMVLFKIAVGRSHIGDASLASKEQLPAGYDSFCVGHEVNEKDSTYRYDYFLKNANQVLPEYIVTFEYDPMVEKNSRERPHCDNCEKTYATVHCAADMANLCQDCDVNLHNANKLVSRHQRTPIGHGADVFGKCRHHNDKLIEFFCSTCHVPVCVHCKMVGNHSSGEASKHKLVAVAEAFEQVRRESKAKDQVLEAKRQEISSRVDKIHGKAKQVESLQKDLEAELADIYKRAVTEVRNKIQDKMQVLSGDESELKRQDMEIQSLEAFLEYIRSGVDACHLLNSWSRHQSSRQELQAVPLSEGSDIKSDLKVVGELKVIQDASAPVQYKSPTKARIPQAKPAKKLIQRQARRTSEFFAETLSALDDLGLERSVYVNDHNDDEKSVVAGFNDYDSKF